MINLTRTITTGVLCSAMFACASAGRSPSGTQTSQTRISRMEVAESNASTAYELISRLRPNWLRGQPTASVAGGVIRSQSILVYLNRQRLEDLNALKSISIGEIDSAEWVDAARVQTVLTDVPSGPISGAIVIRTR